jgi:hypothetical protein
MSQEHFTMTPSSLPTHVHVSIDWILTLDQVEAIKILLAEYGIQESAAKETSDKPPLSEQTGE